MNARSKNAAVINRQKKAEADWTAEHEAASAQWAKDAAEDKKDVMDSAAIRRQGGMTYGDRALTQ